MLGSNSDRPRLDDPAVHLDRELGVVELSHLGPKPGRLFVGQNEASRGVEPERSEDAARGLDLVERKFDLVGEREQRLLSATGVFPPYITISQDGPDDASGQGEDHDLSGAVGEVHPDVAGPLGCHHGGGDQERNRPHDDDADDDPGALAVERGSHVEHQSAAPAVTYRPPSLCMRQI